MSKTIQKKVLSKYFKEIESGLKTYEFRLADWDCQTGDTLVLLELDDETQSPTGRSLSREVGYVGKTKDLSFWTPEQIEKYGYQIISLIDRK